MRRQITWTGDAPDPAQRDVRPPQEGTPSGRYRCARGAHAVPMVPHPSAPLRGLPKEGGDALRGLQNHCLLQGAERHKALKTPVLFSKLNKLVKLINQYN